jgi:hypothetical protein
MYAAHFNAHIAKNVVLREYSGPDDKKTECQKVMRLYSNIDGFAGVKKWNK